MSLRPGVCFCTVVVALHTHTYERPGRHDNTKSHTHTYKGFPPQWWKSAMNMSDGHMVECFGSTYTNTQLACNSVPVYCGRHPPSTRTYREFTYLVFGVNGGSSLCYPLHPRYMVRASNISSRMTEFTKTMYSVFTFIDYSDANPN